MAGNYDSNSISTNINININITIKCIWMLLANNHGFYATTTGLAALFRIYYLYNYTNIFKLVTRFIFHNIHWRVTLVILQYLMVRWSHSQISYVWTVKLLIWNVKFFSASKSVLIIMLVKFAIQEKFYPSVSSFSHRSSQEVLDYYFKLEHCFEFIWWYNF